MNTVLIRVDPSDAGLMMDECVKMYLKHHPEMEGVYLTQKKMLKELVRFYLEAT